MCAGVMRASAIRPEAGASRAGCGKGKQRSAERYYDTAPLDDIKALPVGDLAADDCALFLWGVWPLFLWGVWLAYGRVWPPENPGAQEVIKAWGFEYKTTGFVWVKQNESGEGLHWGMGYWTPANTEFCLLATRGNPRRLAKDVHQVILAPVGRHSEKPQEAPRASSGCSLALTSNCLRGNHARAGRRGGTRLIYLRRLRHTFFLTYNHSSPEGGAGPLLGAASV